MKIALYFCQFGAATQWSVRLLAGWTDVLYLGFNGSFAARFTRSKKPVEASSKTTSVHPPSQVTNRGNVLTVGQITSNEFF
jgi:hypothetical protein